MMSCPSGHCLCRTVQLESIRIWNDLQDAETLNSPVHEDTITQTFALTLNRQHGGQCRVHLFGLTEESKNGSDFLWVFFSPNLARHFRVAVQAKRLYRNGKYEAFKVAQAQAMDAYARSILAASVYVFYNFMPFRRGYYGFRGRRRCVDRRMLYFDHGRDLGAIYVPTEEHFEVVGWELVRQTHCRDLSSSLASVLRMRFLQEISASRRAGRTAYILGRNGRS